MYVGGGEKCEDSLEMRERWQGWGKKNKGGWGNKGHNACYQQTI